MAIAHVQSRGVQGDDVASQALAYTSNVTLNNWLLVICCARAGAGASSVSSLAITDSLGHSWTVALDALVGDGHLVVAWAKANASAACTVTANPTAAAADSSDVALLIFEYSGLYTGTGGPFVDRALDIFNLQSEPRQLPPLLTYGEAGDRLLLGALFSTTVMTIDTGSGWTQRLEDETSPLIYHAEDRIVGPSTLVVGEWTTPGNSAGAHLVLTHWSSVEPTQLPPFKLRTPRQFATRHM